MLGLQAGTTPDLCGTGIESRVVCMLGKHSITELHISLTKIKKKKTIEVLGNTKQECVKSYAMVK